MVVTVSLFLEQKGVCSESFAIFLITFCLEIMSYVPKFVQKASTIKIIDICTSKVYTLLPFYILYHLKTAQN